MDSVHYGRSRRTRRSTNSPRAKRVSWFRSVQSLPGIVGTGWRDFWPTFVDSASRVLPDALTNPPLRVKYTRIQMYKNIAIPVTGSIFAQE
jgi:hypothetical protein